MEDLLFVLAKVVSIYLGIASFGMFLRFLLSLFLDPEGSVILALLFYLTEPIIMPVRLICAKLHIGENTPIDLPFIISYLVIFVLQLFLPPI